jgi:DNA-binding MarR family transcriptional regulator
VTDEAMEQAITMLSRTSRLLDSVRLRVWDERGLTLPQLRILYRVREEPGIGVRELAQSFGVSASNISQQMDKLVTRGLVARADRIEDRRQVAHTLTPAGEAVASEVSHAGRVYLGEVLATLAPRDRDRLTRLLAGVLDVAARLGPPSLHPDAEPESAEAR